jgi:flagellar basal body rod protein FlgC
MSSVLSIASGGLQSAARRIAVSANAIATASASRPATGVRADNPDASLVKEAVAQIQALASYRANATVIRIQRDLDEALLDVLA